MSGNSQESFTGKSGENFDSHSKKFLVTRSEEFLITHSEEILITLVKELLVTNYREFLVTNFAGNRKENVDKICGNSWEFQEKSSSEPIPGNFLGTIPRFSQEFLRNILKYSQHIPEVIY